MTSCPALLAQVVEGLEQLWSPEEISRRLRLEHSDDPMMQVSHETIYQSLYVQGRGELRRELHEDFVVGSQSEHFPQCRRSPPCNLIDGWRGRVLHLDPVGTLRRLRTLPSEGVKTTLLLWRPAVLTLEVEVAHSLRHQRPVLEGQRLPEVMAVLVVLGDQNPPSRATTQPSQEVFQGIHETRQRKHPLLTLIVPGDRGR